MNKDLAIAVGGGGTIIRTTDAGLNWSIQRKTYAGEDLNAVSFVDSLNGIAVGYSNHSSTNGTLLLHSTDGGQTWANLAAGLQMWLEDVAFWDRENGVAVGYLGALLRTTDGGYHWTPEPPPTSNDLYAIDFTSTGVGNFGIAVGEHGAILCSAVSPLPTKTWIWTGGVDSSWNTPGNWSPTGVPLPADSVVIPETAHHPVIYEEQQQIAIGSLMILSGGKLTLTDALKRFVVLGDVNVYGTLEITTGSEVSIVTGGSWLVRPGEGMRMGFRRIGQGALVDQGFLPAKSTVYFAGNGNFENNFYNLGVDSSAVIQTTGDVSVAGTITTSGEIALRDPDTLVVSNDDPQAVAGRGRITGRGTIRRAIRTGVEEKYRFESRDTYARFTPGAAPTFVSMRTYAGVNPDSMSSGWVEVTSRIDKTTHTAIADSVRGFSRWTIMIPRPQPGGGPAVQRVYDIGTSGGNSYTANLSLRYEVSELPVGVQEEALRLFRTEPMQVPNDRSGSIIPGRYELNQNFPNPFNPTTTIRFGLPTRSQVKLMVFNTLGQEVAHLVDGEVEAGYHETRFHGEGLASGVYFYRLQAGDFLQTKRLLLLR